MTSSGDRSSHDERSAANEQRPTREEALRVADDLFRRLSEWDMLYVKPDGSGITADAPYWQGEIKRTRDYIAGARA